MTVTVCKGGGRGRHSEDLISASAIMALKDALRCWEKVKDAILTEVCEACKYCQSHECAKSATVSGSHRKKSAWALLNQYSQLL